MSHIGPPTLSDDEVDRKLKTAVDAVMKQLSSEELPLATPVTYTGRRGSYFGIRFPKVGCEIDWTDHQLYEIQPDALTERIRSELQPLTAEYLMSALNINNHLSLMRDEIENLSLAKQQRVNASKAESDLHNAEANVFGLIEQAVKEGKTVLAHQIAGNPIVIKQVDSFDPKTHSFQYSSTSTMPPHTFCFLPMFERVDVTAN